MQSDTAKWIASIVETLPSLVFLTLFRLGYDLEFAGWVGVGLSALALIGVPMMRARYDTIMLGINIHLLLVTPLIVATFALGQSGLGRTLSDHSYQGVLLTILGVGIVLTVFSERGFAGLEGPRSTVRKQSLTLLIATGAAVVWAFTYGGATFVGVAIPIIALVVMRRLLARHPS